MIILGVTGDDTVEADCNYEVRLTNEYLKKIS
jgi:hypothetical protein